MKKIIPALLVFLCGFISAQSTQFFYDYTFIRDSTDRKNTATETMVLNVEKNKSEYFSAARYAADSVLAATAKEGKSLMPPMKRMINDRIVKTLPSHTIIEITNISFDKYEISQTINFNWKIDPQTDTVLGYKVQKATTEYGGRKWTARFAKDIPINDGPYKFFGLPGLIVKLEDSNQNHVITLKGIKNVKNNFSYPAFSNNSNVIKTSYEKYRAAFKNYRKDPAADMIGKVPDQKDAEGHFRTGEEIIRESRQLMLERLKKDNNLLELDLLK